MRIVELDRAKALGIVLIVLGHSPFFQHGSIPFLVLGQFHVAVFLIISGLFLRADEAFLTTVRKRSLDLLVPYLVVAGALLLGRVLRGRLEPEDAASSLALGNGDRLPWIPMWFLPFLWSSTLLATLIAKGLMRIRHRQAAWSLLVALLLVAGGVEILRLTADDHGSSRLLNADLSLVGAGFLLLGWLFRDHLEGLVQHVPKQVYLASIGLFITISVDGPWYMDLNERIYSNLVWTTLAAMCGSLCVIGLARLLSAPSIDGTWFGQLLDRIGQATLVILIFHSPLLYRLDVAGQQFHGVLYVLSMVAAILISITVPLALDSVIRRVRPLMLVFYPRQA